MEALIYILFAVIIAYGIIRAFIDIIRDAVHAPKCEHGVRNGNKRNRNRKFKCAECQIAFEREQKLDEERRKKELEYKKNELEIQNKFASLLSRAVLLRKQALLSDERLIRQLSPLEFENFIVVLYTRLGYEVVQTPYSNDGGKDAFAYKDGVAYLIECKHYQKDAVIGRPMLQKLYAAMTEENIENGIFIATCEYSKPAIDYGRKMNIKTLKLIDILDLVWKTHDPQIDVDQNYTISCRTCGDEIVFKLCGDVESKTCINGHIVKNVFWNTKLQEPLCPRCGGKYRLVHGYRGDFYGCCNYPSCRHRKSRDEYEVEAGIKKRRKLPSYPNIKF